MISLLRPSSSAQSASSSVSGSKDGRRGSMASRLGIGVDEKTLRSSTLGPQRDQPESPSSPRLEDPAHGILIHHERQPSLGQQSTISSGDQHFNNGIHTPETASAVSLPQESVHLPVSPALSANVQLISNAHEKIPADQLPQTVRPGVPVRAASKIRFAPLPNPRRQRSLSTGRNIAITATLESDGTRTLQRHARMDPDQENYFSEPSNTAGYDDEEAVDDVDFDEDEGDDDAEGRGKRSSWKTMGMGNWKSGSFSSGHYTRKLLKPLLSPTNVGSGNQSDTGLERSTSRESGKRTSADIVMPGSQSLRKTFSTTSGFIGTSPFRSAAEHERKRSFFPSSSSMSGSSGGMDILGMGDKKARQAHRASATPDFSSLSASLGRQADTEFAAAGATSPRPVKMLNGRVYGQRRQAEMAQKSTSEPEFVEWGGMMGTTGGGMGSIAGTSASSDKPSSSMGSVGNASADDEDDGSGMAWIKKRREQRDKQRRESEAGLTGASPDPSVFSDSGSQHGGSLPTSSDSHKSWSRGDGISAQVINQMPSVSEDRVATPIQSEYHSLPPPIPIGGFDHIAPSAKGWTGQELSEQGRLQAFDEKHQHDDPGHIVQAVQIPGQLEEAVHWRQSFPIDDSMPSALPPNDDTDEEEDEDDEENDFESDDEEELALEEERNRSTSSAAGVEVVSRHRD
ncbi:hypothetical protein NliqN6_2118 [Naganishia liquefaciens]|uniref:Uncharacterized protein n=1 Tax=Naganishia liquefaciens TaxID=104408 RepID=A0A8H3TRP0_9TREE|nr:hypothetical protein NliqN6_2118 [Naganishia liquefaciens]